ncbi:MraZ protein [Mycoplasmoides fastidiosum]|uniref:Transcriptional regulator MraZ n=1 Tax=Mycoplasmoides fastidiosum TaxID=92758 RepID=A0ABU0LZY2_9BACT|nr:division/cell wall cluster transcriptional repressor MraZ [Mycoplasmoides fastidiosum]MDQ0514266.1 MraZ protein [Mycoplasmoides fastidiosum]UUD37326.1 division/cell wall cluster transcriptional repressor MraZ [Mycoplasmoides fastidiosum]
MDFLGTFNFNLDDKKRLILPAKWRSALSNDVVLSKGYDGALELRSASKFKEYYDQELKVLDTKNRNARIILRQRLGYAANLVVDRSFRILLPTNLIKIAGIEHEVCLVGVGDLIEIWDVKKYAEFQAETDNKLEDASAELESWTN